MCVCTSKPEKESVNRVRTPDTGGSEWSLLWTATEDSGSAGAIRFARAEAHVAADPYLALYQPLGCRSQLAHLAAVGRQERRA